MAYRIVTVVVVLLPIVVAAVLSAFATRPTNLGVRNGRLAPCPSSPNCVLTQAGDEAHRMEPIPFSGSLPGTMRRLKAAIGSTPWLRIVTEAGDYVHVEATSLIFRFVDDSRVLRGRGEQAYPFSLGITGGIFRLRGEPETDGGDTARV
jgi:uncharacterized protein (DUF1499 family)